MGREILRSILALLILLIALVIAQVLHKKTGILLTTDGILNFIKFFYQCLTISLPKAAGAALIFFGYRFLCLGFLKEDMVEGYITTEIKEPSELVFIQNLND